MNFYKLESCADVFYELESCADVFYRYNAGKIILLT